METPNKQTIQQFVIGFNKTNQGARKFHGFVTAHYIKSGLSETKSRKIARSIVYWIENETSYLEQWRNDLGQRLYHIANNTTEIPKCYCGNELKWQVGKYGKTCSHACNYKQMSERAPRRKYDAFIMPENELYAFIDNYYDNNGNTDSFQNKLSQFEFYVFDRDGSRLDTNKLISEHHFMV